MVGGDGIEEGEEVLGDEDHAGADEADLREGYGAEDHDSELWASDSCAQLAVTAAVAFSALEEKTEADAG